MSENVRFSQKMVAEAMADIGGMQQAANFAGDVSDLLNAVQRKGYPEAFNELEEHVDEYIGGLRSAGVILLLAYALRKGIRA